MQAVDRAWLTARRNLQQAARENSDRPRSRGARFIAVNDYGRNCAEIAVQFEEQLQQEIYGELAQREELSEADLSRDALWRSGQLLAVVAGSLLFAMRFQWISFLSYMGIITVAGGCGLVHFFRRNGRVARPSLVSLLSDATLDLLCFGG